MYPYVSELCAFARKEKKRKIYAFWRQCNEKPSVKLGCPGLALAVHVVALDLLWVAATPNISTLLQPTLASQQLPHCCGLEPHLNRISHSAGAHLLHCSFKASSAQT